MRGDVITGIEDCQVRDLNSWLTCLENIWEADPVGYCVQNEMVSRLSNNSEGYLLISAYLIKNRNSS